MCYLYYSKVINYTDRVTNLATLPHHTKFPTEKRFAGQLKCFHNTDKFLELRGYFFDFKIEICTLLKDFKEDVWNAKQYDLMLHFVKAKFNRIQSLLLIFVLLEKEQLLKQENTVSTLTV